MNYEELNPYSLPTINGVTVIGDRVFEDYGLVAMSTNDINELYLETFGYLL